MKKLFLCLLFCVFVSADDVKIDKLRTELYSKSGKNTLKKVELSMEFVGKDLKDKQNKLIDSINTVISGFFYEDIFTELGKVRFKETLSRVILKKYQITIDEMYILSLSGVEKFDLEELKKFLEDADLKPEDKQAVEQGIKKAEQNKTLEVAPVENLRQIEQNKTTIPKIPPLPDVSSILNSEPDTQNQDLDSISIDNLKIPSLPEEIKLNSIQNPNNGFDVNLEPNSSR